MSNRLLEALAEADVRLRLPDSHTVPRDLEARSMTAIGSVQKTRLREHALREFTLG